MAPCCHNKMGCEGCPSPKLFFVLREACIWSRKMLSHAFHATKPLTAVAWCTTTQTAWCTTTQSAIICVWCKQCVPWETQEPPCIMPLLHNEMGCEGCPITQTIFLIAKSVVSGIALFYSKSFKLLLPT